MKNDELHGLLSSGPDEKTGQRRREALLMSLVAHLLVVFWVALGPDLLPQPDPPDSPDRETAKRLGFLALPREYENVLREPPPARPKIPDKRRMPQSRTPEINPKALRVPDGNPNPRQAEKPEPAEESDPPNPKLGPSASQPTSPSSPTPQPVQDPASDGQTGAQNRKGAGSIKSTSPFLSTPKGKALKSNLKDLYAGLRLPGGTTPGSRVRQRISGRPGQGSPGESRTRANFDKRQPDFSVERPTILSDTQGVDFGPWLTAIYFRVRNNWFSVIPQAYRSGRKGVVVIVFDVRRNGSLEELEIVRSSSFSPYDRAAISSLKLSEPFPNFPDAFKRDRLTLQFTYLYNIRL